MWLEGLGQLKSNDLIGNRTRDLTAINNVAGFEVSRAITAMNYFLMRLHGVISQKTDIFSV
jgi:hypothetical protein